MDKRLKWFLWGFLFTMAALGMAFTVHGPVTTKMMEGLSIDPAQRGLLITLQGLGTLASVIVWTLFGERTNKALLITIGTVVIMAASIGLSFNPGYFGMMPVLLIYGFGFTIIDVMCNAIAMDVYPRHKSVLMYLHAAFGVGAIGGSLASAWVTQIMGWQYAYLALAALLLVCFIVYGASALKAFPLMPYREKHQGSGSLAIGKVARKGAAWAIFFGCMLFGAYEVGPIIWLSRYFENGIGLGTEIAGAAVAAFFGGIVISRFLAPLLLRKLKLKTLLIVGPILAGSAILGLCFVQDAAGALILTILAGAFAGAQFPLTVMLGRIYFPKYTSTTSAIAVLGFAVAVISVPYIMGALETASTLGMKLSFIIVAACTILIAVCFIPLNPAKASALHPAEPDKVHAGD